MRQRGKLYESPPKFQEVLAEAVHRYVGRKACGAPSPLPKTGKLILKAAQDEVDGDRGNDERHDPRDDIDAAVILNRVREGKGTFGYNAASGEYGDMIEMGILDPTKVTRLALQNAASVAGLFLTTEASITEAPKEESHSHAAPAGMEM